MIAALDGLRELNMPSVLLRLLLAMLLGGIIGLDRGLKQRAAGFRTYMLVCLGATLTMLLSLYENAMLLGPWAATAAEVGIRTDVSRFGAQVINGIGFLATGTIIVTGRQEVKGLTTAAALWTSACMGLAIGAGFYECVLIAFVLMVLCFRLLPVIEGWAVEHARNINLYVEFTTLDDIGAIIARIKSLDVHIYEVELDRGQEEDRCPSAVFTIRLHHRTRHEHILASLSDLEGVVTIDEI